MQTHTFKTTHNELVTFGDCILQIGLGVAGLQEQGQGAWGKCRFSTSYVFCNFEIGVHRCPIFVIDVCKHRKVLGGFRKAPVGDSNTVHKIATSAG